MPHLQHTNKGMFKPYLKKKRKVIPLNRVGFKYLLEVLKHSTRKGVHIYGIVL